MSRFQRKSLFFLLALNTTVYDNILPAKPPFEIWEHGHITTIESSRATNTRSQPIKHVVNKHVAASPEVNWGWWLNCYCGRQERWPKTAERSRTSEGGRGMFSCNCHEIELQSRYSFIMKSSKVQGFKPVSLNLQPSSLTSGLHRQVKEAWEFSAQPSWTASYRRYNLPKSHYAVLRVGSSCAANSQHSKDNQKPEELQCRSPTS